MTTKRKRNSRRPGRVHPMPVRGQQRINPFGSAIPSWRMEASGDTTSVHLYGAIGGWFGGVDAAELVPQIRAIDTAQINLYVNSPGGDVYDAIAIRNALRQHPARVVVTVDGMAASAASFIACAGDEVIMGSNAEVMIHDAWTIAMGNAEDMRVVASDLDRISDNIAGMYAAKAGGDAGDWRAVMKAETWYSAEEAVDAGLADRLDTDATASAAPFDLSVFAYAGRAAAPAPSLAFPTAAMATNRNKENSMNPEQLAQALADGTISQAQHDTALAAYNAINASAGVPSPVADPAQQADLQAGPAAPPAPRAHTRSRNVGMNLREFAQHMATEYGSLNSNVDPIQRVRAALEDVIPADDAGGAFVNREDWVGQVFRASDEERRWIDAIGVPEQMNTLKGKGWRFGITIEDDQDPDFPEAPGTPEVDEYAGDKTDVPSNPIGTLEVLFDPFRIAGGWDVDRAYFDFADPEFWEALVTEATKDYKRKSDVGVRTRMLAGATDTPTADVDETAAGGAGLVLKQLRSDLNLVAGGHANRVFLGSYLFDLIENLKEADMPLWLRNAVVGAGDTEGSANVGQLRIQLDPLMTAKESAAFDSRGFKVKERSPFWVKAENIGKGGIDVGVFSYLRLEKHDPRLIVKRDYA